MNLSHSNGLPGLVVLAAAALVTALYLRTKRGQPLAQSATIAEEKHASLMWAMVFMLLAAVVLAVAGRAGNGAGIWGGIGASTVLGACAIFALSGFQYRFTAVGVEIRTMGFRLRSIAAADIHDYRIERWPWIRGYGIRGIGSSRAYTWGSEVVHVRIAQGDVYLGHDEPERIIHDLDMMRALVH
jgi:hypothetical protein